MLKEHDVVVLMADAPEDGLKAGDVGTIIAVHGRGAEFAVEVVEPDGWTAGIAVVPPDQVRLASADEIKRDDIKRACGEPAAV